MKKRIQVFMLCLIFLFSSLSNGLNGLKVFAADTATGNTGALKVNVKFDNTKDWDAADVITNLSSDGKAIDVAGYKTLSYDVLIPNPDQFTGALKLGQFYNGDWKDIYNGANQADTINVKTADKVIIKNITYAKIHQVVNVTDNAQKAITGNESQLGIRLVGSNSNYTGPIYLDNIVLSGTSKTLTWDFENTTVQGFDKASWETTPFDGTSPVSFSTDINIASGNTGSLKANVKFTNTGWETADVLTNLAAAGKAIDVSGYNKLSYDVLIPNPDQFTGALKLGQFYNGDWKDIYNGANQVDTIDVKTADKVVIKNITYAKIHQIVNVVDSAQKAITGNESQLGIRLVGSNSTYAGPIYLDNIVLSGTSKTLTWDFENTTAQGFDKASWETTPFDGASPVSFSTDINTGTQAETTLSITSPKAAAQLNGIVDVAATVTTPSGITVTKTEFKSQNGTSINMTGDDSGNYTCKWDTNKEIAGDTSFTITVTTSDSKTISKTNTVTILVSNKATDLSWNFDKDKTTQDWVKGWGTGFDESNPVQYSEALKGDGNTGALQVNLNFNGKGGYEDANFQVYLLGENKNVDVSGYRNLTFDVYIPDTGKYDKNSDFKLGEAFNGPSQWNQFPAASYGFEDIKLIDEINPLPTKTINGVKYFVIHRSIDIDLKGLEQQLTLRFSNYNTAIAGAVYVDNISLKTTTDKLFLALKTPGDNENVSGNVNVSALVSAPSSIKITKVIFKSEGGISSTMLAGDAGLYTYQWDTTKLNEGTNKYTITLETSDGKNLSKNASVFVKNSKTDISIISPTYDANIQGTYAVKAKISNKAEQVKDVTLNIGDKVVPMLYDKTEDLYIANVDTTKITDGTYSFFIKATDSTAVIESFVDAMINNKGFSTGIVKANGSNFEVDGKQFNYSGWNAYSYPFSDGVTIGSNTSKVSWDNTGKKVELYVPQGTNIPFEQYVDSCMLEARKTGLNVVRTWGFNSDVSQAHSFYKVDANGVWQFNEDEFKRFDYIMDSAKKHGVRVIVVFDNYWTAYGGITAETAHVGLPNALDFFYDLKAKQLYENYISNFVKRINTVNNIAYKEDPTVFSWELMNEPRMDYNQDTSADHSLFDPTGARLKSWASTEAKFIKSLDSKHMVSLGAEGVGQMVHGQAYGGDQSGYGSNPVKNVMSADGIDFTTFHPYVNTIYSAYNLEQTKEFIQNFVKESKEIGKPAVMEEFGIQREDNPADIADFSNQKTNVLDSNWNELRDTWNKVMLATFRRAGGDGTNIWQFSVYGGIDNSFDVVAYAPEDLASIYHKSVDILAEESKLMQITNSNMFTDVLGGQYKQSINEVAYAGLMNGSNGKFNPEGSVSTNDIIEILEKLNISTEGLLSNDGDKKITRIQAIELINKALRPTPVDLNSLKSEKYPNLDMRFNDISSLSADQVNALRSMFVALIIDDGSDGTNFRPNNNLTRAELAQMMSRVTDFLTYSIKATKVDLAVTSKTMNVKDNVVLVATVSPANATSKAVTWKSTNEKVATVDKNGKVTAVGAGTADIIVTTVDGAYTSKCIVTVNEVVEEAIKVTKVDLDVTSKTLNIKDTVVLVATVSPANATNKTITWKSTNEKVATVDKNGKVTAVGAGTADIIVITVDGAYTSKCIVTVNAIVDKPGTIPVDNPGTTPVTNPVSVVIFNNATDGVQVIINAIKNDTTGQINIDASNNSKIAKSIFEAIKGKNINIVIKAGLITWTFNGKDIKSPMDLDVSLKTPSQSLVDKINNKVKQLTGGSKKTFCFSFNHDGPLPGIATVKLFMGKDWANKTVILRRYFSSKDTIENVLNQGNLKVDGQGYVTFRLDHCSDYFITEANANLPQTGSAVDMQSLIIVGLIMIIGGVALSFKRRKKI